MRWWGPRVYTSPSCRIDLRVGGRYLVCMRSPQGEDYWSTGAYREIRDGGNQSFDKLAASLARS
jgi:uncharacterized protein YndB with AHSA1/START domain